MTPFSPLTVVFPLVGEPRDLVAEVRHLTTDWPDDVDGRVVVAAASPSARERTLLADVAEVAELLPLDVERGYGALAVAAILLEGGPLLLAGTGLTPEDVRAALTSSGPRWTERWALLSPEEVAHSVLTAARDLPSLVALAQQVLEGPGRRLSSLARPLLSASLIVKDEQDSLPTCLASLRGRVDEIVVCDTGSSDRTVEIAEVFGATVVHTTWSDDFAAARNVALAACTGAWVLSIDADERLVAPRRGELRDALSARGPGALGVLISSTTDDRGEAGFEHEAVRLFRRDGVHWVGAVHESVVRTATGEPPEAVRFAGAHLLHDGYLDSVYLTRGKAARNLALAEKEYVLATSGQSSRPVAKAAYELARALSLVEGTADRQESLLREALETVPADLSRLASSVATRLAALLRTTERPDEAVAAAKRAVALTPSDPSAVLELATSLAGSGDVLSGLATIDAWAARTGPAADEVVVHNAALADATLPEIRGVMLLQLERWEEAWCALERVAGTYPSLFGSWSLLVEVAQHTQPDAWAEKVAALCPPEPHHLLDACSGLAEPQLTRLHEALRDRGVSPEEHTAAARMEREVTTILEAHDATDIQAAAEALEDDDPELALQTWLQLPWSSARQVALARCAIALDDVERALDVLDGIDPAQLVPSDRLTVAWLASHAGDRESAIALVCSLPEELGPLAQPVAELRALLGLPPLPVRVESLGTG
ncbi:MAG: glycosyltransferase [Frankiales bacterium]|nr:glycosyltransferase [Frankiales bacterium]